MGVSQEKSWGQTFPEWRNNICKDLEIRGANRWWSAWLKKIKADQRETRETARGLFMPGLVGHVRQLEFYPKGNGSGSCRDLSISSLQPYFYFYKPTAIIHGNNFLLSPLLPDSCLESSTLYASPSLHQQGLTARSRAWEVIFGSWGYSWWCAPHHWPK